MPTYKVDIIDKIYDIKRHSLQLDTVTLQKGVATFQIVNIVESQEDVLSFEEDQEVKIFPTDINQPIEFGGFLQEARPDLTAGGKVTWNMIVKGYGSRLDEITYTGRFTGETVTSIVTTIITDKLLPENYTIGQIDSITDIVSDVIFEYKNLREILNETLTYGDFYYFVNAKKEFFFLKKGTLTGPDVDLRFKGLGNVNGNTFRYRKVNNDYRNRQTLLGGRGIETDTITKKGDGTSREFNLGTPLYLLREVRVNSVVKTVGIKGKDSGKDFYWNFDDNTIVQDSAGVILLITDILEADGDFLFDIIWSVDNPLEILKRAEKSGTSGIVENIERVDIIGLAILQEYGQKLLSKHSREGEEVNFQTFVKREEGQALKVYAPDLGILGSEFTVISTSGTDYSDNRIKYFVTATKDVVTNGLDFFRPKTMFSNRAELTNSEAGSAINKPFSKDWFGGESPQLFGDALFPSQSLVPSNSLLPGSIDQANLSWVAWTNGGVEVGRVPIDVKQETTNQILTIAWIPIEVTGLIENIRWIASDGVTIYDEQSLNETKTDKQIFQISKTDTRLF